MGFGFFFVVFFFPCLRVSNWSQPSDRPGAEDSVGSRGAQVPLMVAIDGWSGGGLFTKDG